MRSLSFCRCEILLEVLVFVMNIWWLFSHSIKTSAKTEEGQEVVKLSPLPKRAKRTYLAIDKDKEVIGYVIPVFRAKWVTTLQKHKN